MRVASSVLVVVAAAVACCVVTTFGGVASGRMVSGAARAAAASCRIAQAVNPRPHSELDAVSATSSRNAWAVGYSWNLFTSQSLIEHWNGKAWKVQASPKRPGARENRLAGVAATSTTNAWAVGSS